MNSLLQLSNAASQVERLQEVPSSSGSPSNNRENQFQQSERSNSRESLTVPYVSRDQERERTKSSELIKPLDRKTIKDKIKMAFRKKANNYDDLLELCSQFAEQRVFDMAPTKLDYYKTGIQCCKTVFDVSDALNANTNSLNNSSSIAVHSDASSSTMSSCSGSATTGAHSINGSQLALGTIPVVGGGVLSSSNYVVVEGEKAEESEDVLKSGSLKRTKTQH